MSKARWPDNSARQCENSVYTEDPLYVNNGVQFWEILNYIFIQKYLLLPTEVNEKDKARRKFNACINCGSSGCFAIILVDSPAKNSTG